MNALVGHCVRCGLRIMFDGTHWLDGSHCSTCDGVQPHVVEES